MNSNITSQLKNLGFNTSEITVYVFLLENGSATTDHIAKKTKILRTNCYAVLGNLLKRGLIEKRETKSQALFVPHNPTTLVRMLEEQKETVSTELLPELLNLYKTAGNKPIIKFYEGIKQIEEVFIQMYEADESILGFTSTKKLFAVASEKFFTQWRKQLKKRNIFLKDILTESSEAVEVNLSQAELGVFFDHRIIPASYGDVAVDILIWNDNVFLFTLEEPIFGTLIQNKYMADTFRMMHSIMWKALKR